MLEVDKTNFEAEVLQADGYVLVDFFGDGCVPCQALMPHVHDMAEVYGDHGTSCNRHLQGRRKGRRAGKRRRYQGSC